MLVVGDKGFLYVVMGEKFLRVAGVFASDLIGFLEDAEGAEGDVLEVAYGRPDEVKAAAGVGR